MADPHLPLDIIIYELPKYLITVDQVRLGRTCKKLYEHHRGCITFIDDAKVNKCIHLLPTFTSLTDLQVTGSMITDDTLTKLTRLQTIRFHFNESVTTTALSVLTNLTAIHFGPDADKIIIDEACLSNLPSLTKLWGCRSITNDTLTKITSLTTLDIDTCTQITDSGLAQMTGLRCLRIGRNRIVTDLSLIKLTNLCILSGPGSLSDNTLSKLTSLTYIDIFGSWNITENGLRSLPNLRGCPCYARPVSKEFIDSKLVTKELEKKVYDMLYILPTFTESV